MGVVFKGIIKAWRVEEAGGSKTLLVLLAKVAVRRVGIYGLCCKIEDD